FANNEAEQDLRMMKVKMKNLRRLPNHGRRAHLRPHPIRHIHRAKTGLEHPPNPRRKPGGPHASPRRLTDGLGVTFFLLGTESGFKRRGKAGIAWFAPGSS